LKKEKTKDQTGKARTTTAGRTTSPTRKPNLSAGGRSRAKMFGYHIFHYGQRFEIRNESRHFYKASLAFSRDYIGDGGCDEGADYQNQFSLLSCDGDGLKQATYYGVFRLLVGLASRHARRYRGWLLGASKEPLTDSQIGRLLRIEPKVMAKMLKRFIAVRLLEKIELPDFNTLSDEAQDSDIPDTEGNEKGSDRATKKASESGSHTRTKRSRAQTCAQVRSPYINGNGKTEMKVKVKVKVKGKRKATVGLTASGCKKNNNGNGKSHNRKINAQKDRVSDQVPCPPATQPLPSEPKGTDALGGHKVASFTAGPLAPDLSQAGRRYGLRVFMALGFGGDADNLESQREICSFASQHDKVCRQLAGLGPPAVDAVLSRALREATKIAKRKSTRRKGAVFNSLLDKLCDSAQQRGPP